MFSSLKERSVARLSAVCPRNPGKLPKNRFLIKYVAGLALGILMLISNPGLSDGARLSNPYLKFTPRRIPRGTIALVTYTGPETLTPQKIIWKEITYPFFKNEKGIFQAFLGLPLSVHHRRQWLTLVVSGKEGEKTYGFALRVTLKKYPIKPLRLKKRAKLDKPTIKKIQREREELFRILRKTTLGKLWHGTFMKPVPGNTTSPFGLRRKINGSYISTHRGTDFRAPPGTQVRAINSGRVVFRKKLFLSGLTLVINHGLGLYSLYGHLSAFRVTLNEHVEKGQIIGLSGNTGRSTGPHLHLGVTLCGIAVDPLSLIHLPL